MSDKNEPSLGKVYLVGAGPGDPELITLKARRRIQEAEVLLYDALVHPEQIALAPSDAEKIFVGKRAGQKSARQQRINEMMLEHAQAGKRVVRLKGGDPFLFGRGSEEAEFLVERGVPFEVVPGVPSPLAATAYTGISLTHRDHSSSVAYLTATESVEKDRTSHDWAKLATGVETLVIFMGVRKIESLMQLLIDHGRAPETPVAVVQWASLPKQRTVIATAATIADEVQKAGISMPALTIVGEVVRLHEKLNWFEHRALFGKRVLIPRSAEGSERLLRYLRDEGAEGIIAPTIRILPALDPAPLDEAIRAASSYDYWLFTSANTVEIVWEKIRAEGLDLRIFGQSRVAAIGPKTREALERRGILPDLVAKETDAEGLLSAIEAAEPHLSGKRFMLPRADLAREVLVRGLRERGAHIDAADAYRIAPPDAEGAELIRAAISEGVDAILLSSAQTFRNLRGIAGDEALRGVPLFSIGRITSAAIREAGFEIAAESEETTLESLVQALKKWTLVEARG